MARYRFFAPERSLSRARRYRRLFWRRLCYVLLTAVLISCAPGWYWG